MASDVSADGSIIVGYSNEEHETKILSGVEAARWLDGELEYLGAFISPSNSSTTFAIGVSTDGSVIVGNGLAWVIDINQWIDFIWEAFYWLDTEGMIELGSFVEESGESYAFDVSGDGSIVVGCYWMSGFGSTYDCAFIWDEIHGTRDFKYVLENDYGLDLTGWHLGVAFSMSADGQTIVGMGRNPDGYDEAWIATIPEPATILLMGLGAMLISKKDKRM
jgi:uncharacterized membrane protein